MKQIEVQNQSNSIINVFSKRISTVLSPGESVSVSLEDFESLCFKFHCRNGVRENAEYDVYERGGYWIYPFRAVEEYAFLTVLEGDRISHGETLLVEETEKQSLFGSGLIVARRITSCTLTVKTSGLTALKQFHTFLSKEEKQKYLRQRSFWFFPCLLFTALFAAVCTSTDLPLAMIASLVWGILVFCPTLVNCYRMIKGFFAPILSIVQDDGGCCKLL